MRKKDVAIESKHGAPAGAQSPAPPPPGRRPGWLSHGPPPQRHGEGKTNPLGDRGGDGGSVGAEVEPGDEHQIERHIEGPYGDHHEERPAGVPRADEPAGDDQREQHGGRAREANGREGGGKVGDLIVGREEAHDSRHHRPLDHKNANAQPGRKQGRALSVGERGVGPIGAQCAAYQGGCSGTEKRQEPKCRAEHRGTEGGGAEVLLVREVAEHRRVDEANQRHRDVGEDRGPREREGAAMGPRAHGNRHGDTLARP